MAATLAREQFVRNLEESGLLSESEIRAAIGSVEDVDSRNGDELARKLVASGRLTQYQADAVSERRFSDLVIGNYHILDRLGAGAMGTVTKARHRRMKRVVAIKVLARHAAQSDEFIKRFQREVEAVARLSHPNIVMAYDADEGEAGPFLVMEFVNGRDLASEVHQRGPLPVGEAVDCVIQAARGLAYAHAQGIVHRDIKPANLLRDVGGVVKVADLGLAHVGDGMNEAANANALTQAGTVMGTADYMAPEQALGVTTIDHRADIYSLGCTLYYLLTGKPIYDGPTLIAVLLKHRDAPIPELKAARPGVPAALEEIFRRMVAKQSEARFATTDEVVRALEGLQLAVEPFELQQVPTSATVMIPSSGLILDESESGVDTVTTLGPTAAANQTIVAAPPARRSATGVAILLVEPSRSQAVIIRAYLTKLGFKDVVTAPSGKEALEQARMAPPWAVVSAMHLADITGPELARTMRNEGLLSSTGFVLITSQTDDAHGADAAEGVIRLPKPFDSDRLAQALSAATTGVGNLRVLVVDDSPVARAHVRQVLNGLGLSHLVEAADGLDAAVLLGQETFDLVVTDYNMPRLDGQGLVDYIRNRSASPAVPVIVVTTETDPAKLEALRRLGVAAICEKSFKPEIVRGILERLK
jgi:serine/threonine protein kinase/DNA-binding response OmpR family regulator